MKNQPLFLEPNDNVVIVSTARKVAPEEVSVAKSMLESWGLVVHFGNNLFAEECQFAGSDAQRLEDLQQALDNEKYKAIFCARGGYGTPRIIDDVQWDKFLQHPKWVVGFSDVTVLLNQIHHLGIKSLHAPMTMFFGREEYATSIASLQEFLFGRLAGHKTEPCNLNKNGIADGILTGGNLSVIVNSIGTKTEIETEGTILFLEDLDEYLYHIDRMMLQLKRAGKLKRLAGLAIGHFSAMRDNQVPFGESAYEIIARHVQEYNYPVAFGIPAVHESPNLPLPFGQHCQLTVDAQLTCLDFL